MPEHPDPQEQTTIQKTENLRLTNAHTLATWQGRGPEHGILLILVL